MILEGFPSGSAVKNLPVMQDLQETQVQSLGQEDPVEEGMATHSSTLAWRIMWTEQSVGLCIVHQSPLSMGFFQTKMLECVSIPFSRGSY